MIHIKITKCVKHKFEIVFVKFDFNTFRNCHRKAYVKNGKLSNPINNPKPKGAGASDAKNNTPEIRGRIKATTTE